MTSDYFTNYTHVLESLETVRNRKLRILETFGKSVDEDFQAVLRKRALKRLDEWADLHHVLIAADINYRIGDDQLRFTKMSDLEAILGKDLARSSMVLARPENVSIVKKVFAAVFEDIEKNGVPLGKSAKAYADLRVLEELKKALPNK